MKQNKKYSRRQFIESGAKSMGGILFASVLGSILGCTHAGSFKPDYDYASEPEKFSLKAFDKWYKSNQLYTNFNPNLRWPHQGGKTATFYWSTYSSHGATPGCDYRVKSGEDMVASAPGYVIQNKMLNTGRAGGRIVTVEHYAGYRTRYGHLDTVHIKHPTGSHLEVGQKVARGEPIGSVVTHWQYAKFIMKKADNEVNPDRYGVNHSFLDYADALEGETWSEADKAIAEEKDYNQMVVFQKLLSYLDMNPSPMMNKIHRQKTHWTISWSVVERMDYLEKLYKYQPNFFPGLEKEEMESIQKTFKENQPIVFSLPLDNING